MCFTRTLIEGRLLVKTVKRFMYYAVFTEYAWFILLSLLT